MKNNETYTSFIGTTLLASGPLDEVLTRVKALFDRDPGAPILIFKDENGRQVDFDLRGTLRETLARALPPPERPGPGRPRLGVVAREVSLLPRHWEWLEQQPNGASAALRRLVDEARKRNPGEERRRLAIEAANRFLTAMAGNLPGYEEATRALFGRNQERFHELIREWPPDIQQYAQRLVETTFEIRERS
jgi:hypothetical protein